MSEFQTMRENMVRCQILPENVANPLLIQAFLTIPREKFVPRQLSRVAYMDANFPTSGDTFLLRPATLARLLDALSIKPTDRILYIGGGPGYGPALLSYMGARIIALDEEEALTCKAEALLHELNLSRIEVVLGPLSEGWEKRAPYDKIFIEGCVEKIPSTLFHQLKDQGLLVTLKKSKAHKIEAIKVLKDKDSLSEVCLFDAFSPCLDAFQKKNICFFSEKCQNQVYGRNNFIKN